MKAAEKMGVPLGFKLVRGAYMSMESKIAASLGYASPLHNCIQDMHNCFNDCASFMLEKIANGPGVVVLATHNVESGTQYSNYCMSIAIFVRFLLHAVTSRTIGRI